MNEAARQEDPRADRIVVLCPQASARGRVPGVPLWSDVAWAISYATDRPSDYP